MTHPASSAPHDGGLDAAGWTRTALHRRVLVVVALSQVLGGAGLAAGVTVGALLSQDMLGSTELAGLPAALFTGGSAAAAFLVGRASMRWGRRPGLASGYVAGAVGGSGVALAAVIDSVPLLLVALLVYGSGTATNLQARYAGTDLADASGRGRAVSTVLVATTAGAIAGPNLVEVTGRLAEAAGMPALAGPFVLAAVAYALAGAVLFAFLRPDPLLAARVLVPGATATPATPSAAAAPPVAALAGAPRRLVAAGATAMVLTQTVMVAIMTMTPVHLTGHGSDLGAVGAVIAVHIASMYLPSPVSGWLADRYGRRPVLGAAAVVLLSAGLVAALAPGQSVALLALALGLLGLGWNLGLVGGTALVADATSASGSVGTQGSVDVAVALAGATGGLASGAIVASTSYPLLAVIGAVLALLILPLVVASRAPTATAST